MSLYTIGAVLRKKKRKLSWTIAGVHYPAQLSISPAAIFLLYTVATTCRHLIASGLRSRPALDTQHASTPPLFPSFAFCAFYCDTAAVVGDIKAEITEVLWTENYVVSLKMSAVLSRCCSRETRAPQLHSYLWGQKVASLESELNGI